MVPGRAFHPHGGPVKRNSQVDFVIAVVRVWTRNNVTAPRANGGGRP